VATPRSGTPYFAGTKNSRSAQAKTRKSIRIAGKFGSNQCEARVTFAWAKGQVVFDPFQLFPNAANATTT